jgi:hypothetical protein
MDGAVRLRAAVCDQSQAVRNAQQAGGVRHVA